MVSTRREPRRRQAASTHRASVTRRRLVDAGGGDSQRGARQRLLRCTTDDRSDLLVSDPAHIRVFAVIFLLKHAEEVRIPAAAADLVEPSADDDDGTRRRSPRLRTGRVLVTLASAPCLARIRRMLDAPGGVARSAFLLVSKQRPAALDYIGTQGDRLRLPRRAGFSKQTIARRVHTVAGHRNGALNHTDMLSVVPSEELCEGGRQNSYQVSIETVILPTKPTRDQGLHTFRSISNGVFLARNADEPDADHALTKITCA